MRARSPVKWVERSKTKERGPTDSARQRRYAAQRSNTREVSRCISPARIPGRLTSKSLVSSARIACCDPLRPAVWRVYHIPPDTLLACFDNFRMHSKLILGLLFQFKLRVSHNRFGKSG